MAQLILTTSILALLLFVHPYVTYPLHLRLFRKSPINRRPEIGVPAATLLFSAYNEERSLPDKLANLAEIRALHPGLEVLAYSDMSSDRTLDMLLARPDLLRVVPSTERTGKAVGMRRMVAEAGGDICIFTDANVILDSRSVATLLDYFRDPAIGAVAGTLRYINADASTTAHVGGLYWQLEEHIKTLESRCGSMMGADGSIFASRRSIYPVVPPHLLDDMTVSMSVIFEGLRLISAPDVVAYEKNTTSSSDEFRRKRRIACRAYNTHKYLWPKIRASFLPADIYKYVSHKLLRWFGAPLLAAAALGFSAFLLVSGHPWILLAAWTAGGAVLLLGAKDVRPFAALYEILLSILATFLGIVDSWKGKTYQTWAPAKSRD